FAARVGDRAHECACEWRRACGPRRLLGPDPLDLDGCLADMFRGEGTELLFELVGGGPRWDAIADAKLRALDEAVARTTAHAFEAAVQPRESIGPVCAPFCRGAHGRPQRKRLLAARHARRGAVPRGA